MIKIENYIDGELISNSDNYIDLYNPSIGKKYGQCPNSSIKDLNSSITSSENAFNEWSQFSFKKRSSFLFKIADLLENELDDFAKAEIYVFQLASCQRKGKLIQVPSAHQLNILT